MEQLQAKLGNDPNINTHKLYTLNKNELEQIEKDEVNIQIFKSKVKWTEEAEKNSTFFPSLEKRNFTNKSIKALDANGTIEKEPDKISKEQYNYYQALFSEKLNKDDKSYKDSLNTFLTNNRMPQLNEKQKQACDKTIIEQEILNSIKQLTNGKTPGTDGLSADFYNFFWIDIKKLLINSILYVMKKGNLSIEEKRGIITLLPPQK